MNWRKWNRILHRDLGFLFFGMTIIYALSGIAINHLKDWDPSYIITNKKISVSNKSLEKLSKNDVLGILEKYGEEDNYKKHYYPNSSTLKVFLKGGSLSIDVNTRKGIIESVKRRPIFHQVNFLHYNPGRLWTYFSDFFAISLIIIAVTGLFLIKGKKGITGRGAWLTAIGIIIPILFLIF